MSLATAISAGADPQPLLVVLTPTGQFRGNLPVLTRHPDAGAVERALSRGFSGRLLRLYALQQEYLRQRTGAAPEPAYLLLSDRQGGFPQFGFHLDGMDKSKAGWVDLHASSTVSGRFGAMDQIFPHELLHVIVRQLAGAPRESGANQVHAIGVRTDPVTAFQEGFAEHVQVLSIDDEDALLETAGLRRDASARARADRWFDAYARELQTPWLPVRPTQLRFLLWFSASEQVQRYHAVKANQFARAPAIPGDLLARGDKYAAYLWQSTRPGAAGDPLDAPAVLLSREGVVAHLFWRWATHRALRERYRDAAFYASFGIRAADVTPLENVYLKLFHALHAGRPSDTAGLVTSYLREFPDERDAVEDVLREALGTTSLPDAPEVWLANAALTTGTSLFDQFRGLPRPHTFDVNAATELDWRSVPGVGTERAAQLVRGAPYRDLDDLVQRPFVDEALRARVGEMAAAMAELRTRGVDEEGALTVWALGRPYLVRLGVILIVVAALGAVLARRAGARRWFGALLMGMVAATVVLGAAWILSLPLWQAAMLPVLAGGLPLAAWRGWREHSWRAVGAAVCAWAAAATPALAIARAWW